MVMSFLDTEIGMSLDLLFNWVNWLFMINPLSFFSSSNFTSKLLEFNVRCCVTPFSIGIIREVQLYNKMIEKREETNDWRNLKRRKRNVACYHLEIILLLRLYLCERFLMVLVGQSWARRRDFLSFIKVRLSWMNMNFRKRFFHFYVTESQEGLSGIDFRCFSSIVIL